MATRRFFSLVCTVALCALPVSAQEMLPLPPAFPAGNYTPHGYIDNPYHSFVANRSGVIRSVPPLGFGWWRTGFPGSYGGGAGDHVNYLSFLRMGVTIDSTVFLNPEDFSSSGTELRSAYHTSRMTSYDWTHGSIKASLRFFLAREHTLACLAEFSNNSDVPRQVLVHATHEYSIGPEKWWGSDGISASYVGGADAMVSKIWAYGDVFALGSGTPAVTHFASSSRESWDRVVRHGLQPPSPPASVRGRGPMYATQVYRLRIPAHQTGSLVVLLSRGTNESAALAELGEGIGDAISALQQQLADDQTFWLNCPVLDGDWPESWKRGWVYDFETLRMTVRRPIGIFKHHWDGMQIHAPRVVLGETSLDMMALAYADSRLAREVIEGTFMDAVAANVPCVREDGSMNMISSDGSECGTAPMWGYPFHVIRSIYRSTGDSAWIARIYPRLRAYIDWWLRNRTDAQGWLHCNNSWESGQDGSQRFLVAQGNEAAVADFVRTVDVEASMAEAMLIMEEFAAMTGLPKDVAYWKEKSGQRIENTRAMFVNGWFRDVDGRNGNPIILKDHFDVMMLAPVACDIATEQQIVTLRPMFAYYKAHPSPWLEWPPLMFTYTEAAHRAGESMIAAEAVAATADRVYGRTNARAVVPAERGDTSFYRIPGVANEFWPVRNVPAGGENYGWGATLPTNLLRTIVGFREEAGVSDKKFMLGPALPAALMKEGRRYAVRNLHYRDLSFDLLYAVLGSGRIGIALEYRAPAGVTVEVRDTHGKTVEVTHGAPPSRRITFTANNGDTYVVAYH